MSFDFKPQQKSSFDQGSGVSILRPRILPAPSPEEPSSTEYQYVVYRGDERIGALSLYGWDRIVEKAGGREWVFTLDLGRDWVLEGVRRIKQALDNKDDEFVFLKGLAQGLALAYAGLTHNNYNLRYLAVTNTTALASIGIVILDHFDTSEDGEVLLAEAFMPAHVY